MIKAVIIDDEPAMQEVNSQMLREFFPSVYLAGTSNSVSGAFNLIISTSPDLVFLDIELTDGTGFDLLQKLMPYHFQVIFITAHNSFAVKAIRFSALDYLLKPVTEYEFRDAVQKALELIEKKQNIQLQTEILIESYKKKEVQKKLVLRTSETLHIVEICDICFCKSDNSYTTFYMKDNESIIVSKSLKEYENLLTEYGFFRPHQSYLVNLEYIKKVDKTDGGFIVMKNKKEIPVSSRQMKNLIKLFERF